MSIFGKNANLFLIELNLMYLRALKTEDNDISSEF